MSGTAPTPSARPSLYGRRKGHALRAGQAELVARLLPRLRLDLSRPAPTDLSALFPHPVREVRLEIGFGGGEHLAHRAREDAGVGYIGCEPFLNGVAKLLTEIDADALANVRIHDGDVVPLLAWLPAESLSRVWLLYPDPWPKRRHWKRRLIRHEVLDALARAVRPGAELHFASDWADYADWTLRRLRTRRDFVWTAERAEDWRRPWAGWPGTRYEAKALAEGRTPCYLTFRRA